MAPGRGTTAIGSVRLYLLRDGFVYTADEAVATTTRRHPAVLLLSLDRRPIVLSTRQQRVSGEAILVMPQVTRRIETATGVFAAIQVEPNHPDFRRFVARRRVTEVDSFGAEAFADLAVRLRQAHCHGIPPHEIRTLFDEAVATLCRLVGESPGRDRRVAALIDYLAAQAPADYSFDELLQRANVSPSRLSHLFSEQAGLSLRSFTSWRKIRSAIRLLTTDMSLTAIAHSSGFSDSAHFARTFSSSLGLVPSDFRRRNRVQINDYTAGWGAA